MKNVIRHKSHEKSDKYHNFLQMSEQEQQQQTRSMDLRFSRSKNFVILTGFKSILNQF